MKYEYRFVEQALYRGKPFQVISDLLDRMGAEGWEHYLNDWGYMCFKRRVP